MADEDNPFDRSFARPLARARAAPAAPRPETTLGVGTAQGRPRPGQSQTGQHNVIDRLLASVGQESADVLQKALRGEATADDVAAAFLSSMPAGGPMGMVRTPGDRARSVRGRYVRPHGTVTLSRPTADDFPNMYRIRDSQGRPIGEAEIVIEGDRAIVNHVGLTDRTGQSMGNIGANQLGPRQVRELFIRQLPAMHPEVRVVAGYRMSGARGAPQDTMTEVVVRSRLETEQFRPGRRGPAPFEVIVPAPGGSVAPAGPVNTLSREAMVAARRAIPEDFAVPQNLGRSHKAITARPEVHTAVVQAARAGMDNLQIANYLRDRFELHLAAGQIGSYVNRILQGAGLMGAAAIVADRAEGQEAIPSVPPRLPDAPVVSTPRPPTGVESFAAPDFNEEARKDQNRIMPESQRVPEEVFPRPRQLGGPAVRSVRTMAVGPQGTAQPAGAGAFAAPGLGETTTATGQNPFSRAIAPRAPRDISQPRQFPGAVRPPAGPPEPIPPARSGPQIMPTPPGQQRDMYDRMVAEGLIPPDDNPMARALPPVTATPQTMPPPAPTPDEIDPILRSFYDLFRQGFPATN